jgi:hypothetical protein
VKADLCFGFSSTDWEKLVSRLDHDENAWAEAIGVFERRMKERFFSCIEALEKADTKPDSDISSSSVEPCCIPGFSIVALCCLVIETLQGFREGASRKTEKQFVEFLKRAAFAEAFANDKLAECFVKGVRNGIFHEAETRKWLIRRGKPRAAIVSKEDDGYILNRVPFYEAVKQEFESYLRQLRMPFKTELRVMFKKQMSEICKES